MKDYGLDLHGEMLLEEYNSQKHLFLRLKNVVVKIFSEQMAQSHIDLNAMEARIKREDSLAGKLRRKGSKYQSLRDITDILGVRLIAFYNEDVDRIAAITESLFDIDWANSVDKRNMHQFDSFGSTLFTTSVRCRHRFIPTLSIQNLTRYVLNCKCVQLCNTFGQPFNMTSVTSQR